MRNPNLFGRKLEILINISFFLKIHQKRENIQKYSIVYYTFLVSIHKPKKIREKKNFKDLKSLPQTQMF